MRAMKLAALLLALAAAPAVSQPAVDPAGPVIRPELLTAVSPHVHVVPDEFRPVVPNVGFVVGTKAVLVVDPGLGRANGDRAAAIAARLAPGRRIYVVGTHPHPEHDMGASGFPATARMIRSNAAEADLAGNRRLAGVFAGRDPAMAALLQGADWRAADILFSGEHVLDLGGVTARLIDLGPNHTAGDTAVWVPEDRVLFSGDVAMRHQPNPAAANASVDGWLRSQDRLEALKPARVVPAHGPLGDGATYMQGYRAYFTEIRDRLRAARDRGLPAEAQADAVAGEMAARYPDAGRLRSAIRLAQAGR
jgi:glyoxylase-like metal-dependent hydrolase (beta-lactamase superfamily II)